MDKLSNKTTLNECLQHFDPVENDTLFNAYPVAGGSSKWFECRVCCSNDGPFTGHVIGYGLKWFECRVCCSLDGLELKKGDLILIDPANGEIKGLFRDFVTVKEASKNA